MSDPLISACADCGVATTPCSGKRGCRHIGRWGHYMVDDELWQRAGGDAIAFLCVGCLEARIGRRLCPDDFPDVLINEPDPWDTPRLQDRKRGAFTNG